MTGQTHQQYPVDLTEAAPLDAASLAAIGAALEPDPRELPWDNPEADLRGAVNQYIDQIIEQGPNT